MMILHAHCLHEGEWESYWPQAQRQLRREQRIQNAFPISHNGAWIWTEVLRELGHEVIEFDYRETSLVRRETLVTHPWLRTGIHAIRRRVAVLESLEVRLMNRALLQLVADSRPEIFITYPGERIFPETIASMSRDFGVVTVLWLGRDPVVEGTLNVVESFPFYDFVFTIDPPNVEKFKRYGARKVFYLPLACYPRIHRPLVMSAEDRRRYGASVAFVGTLFDRRPEFLEQLTDVGLSFWSHSWDKRMRDQHPTLGSCYRGKARGTTMLKVLSGAEIVVNVHRTYNSLEGTNMRTFEAAACRTFQLVESRKEIGRLFAVGREIEVFESVPDLKEKIRHYLDRPAERLEMASNAQRRAYAEHTYDARFREMLGILQAHG